MEELHKAHRKQLRNYRTIHSRKKDMYIETAWE